MHCIIVSINIYDIHDNVFAAMNKLRMLFKSSEFFFQYQIILR